MGIFSRFSDIINANINAILDKAEDPEKMVRLMIQEMQETLVEVRTTSAKVIADQKTQERQRDALIKQIDDWENKAALAISKGREDLARAALAEKLNAQQAVELIDQELGQIDTTLATLNDEIAQLQQKLDEAKARQKSLIYRHKTANTQLKVRAKFNKVSIEEALARFESYEAKLDELEGQVESYDLGQKSLANEIEQLKQDDAVSDELAALKSRLEAQKDKKTNQEDSDTSA